jgi:hypothetical protein
VVVAVGEVQQPARDEQRRAVGRDVAHPDRNERPRAVGGDLERHLGKPEHFDTPLERRRGERQRPAVLGALVDREVARAAVGAPRARVLPGGLRAAVLERLLGGLARSRGGARRAEAVGGQGPLGHIDLGRRPALLGDPAARTLGMGPGRPHRVLDPGAEDRLVHDSRIGVLQPVVPPP